jgi:aconitate hydratase
MWVLPLQFPPGMRRHTLGLTGTETFDIPDSAVSLVPGAAVPVRLNRASRQSETIVVTSRVDTRREAEWVRSGGVLPYVLNEQAAA